ncbi:MAG: amino acid adenylation domain-containing protein, partial [Alcanivoracaceae bacterium]|nr:amino acid adenylation domain-containing protein [Alcanivoracaceae bacterium]
ATDVQEQAIAKAIEQDNKLIFDLSNDLMLRVSYLCISNNEGLLLFNMHHIASDGWSMGILIDEFVKLYSSNLKGKANPLAPLTIQYADYAHWQRNWLSGEVLESQLTYWDGQLANLPQVHNLPLDFERPAFQTFNGAQHHFTIDNNTSKQLKSIALEHQSTLFMLIHAAFSILLSRYSNSTDIVIGTPVANRLQKELEGLIGFFVNTLILRADCSKNSSFLEFLKQVRNTNLDAQSNQDVPFEHLVDRLNPPRSTSHNALFQIMLSMDTNEEYELVLPNVNLSIQSRQQVTAKFDLSLNVVDENELVFNFEYNTDLFNAQTIERLAAGLQSLLKGIARDVTQKINQLPLLSDKESLYLLETLNDTQVDHPTDLCIHELFEAQVLKTPNHTAVVCKDQSLSYSELNKQANQLARHLISQGVKADDFVGLCVERSLEMMIGLLAILKAGGAYLPLDPSYPKDRLTHMLEDSQVQLLLTQQHLLKELSFDKQQIICIDEPVVLSDYSTVNINKKSIGLDSSKLAYIIYTSGSTGQPKGAAVEHRNETNLLYWYCKKYNLNSDDKVLILSAIGFDLTQKNLFAPLISGASVQFATSRFYDVNKICHFIEENKITLTNCAPSVFYPLVEHQQNRAKLSSLRCVLFGGEAIAFDRLSAWLNNAATDLQLINMYGPTECTDISCAYQIPIKENNNTAPIGRANDNVQLYVLNEQQQLSPFGVAGELCVGGLGVSRGYLNQGQLTAEKFIPHPFSDSNNAKIYRTGDLVKWTKDAQEIPQLEFIGRIDSQIKIRGFRVELGEIESLLNTHKDISQSVVIYDNNKGQLHAYIVVHNQDSRELTLIKAFLKKKLPEYMLPHDFIIVDKLPLNTHGKIDKSALSELKGSVLKTLDSTQQYIKPRGEIQIALTGIWSQLLNIPESEISVDANFFELGGHSLLTIRLIAELRTVFDCELSVRDIFETPQLSQFAQQIIQSNSTARAPITAIKRENRQLTPSYAQQRLWFINQLDGGSTHYNTPGIIEVKGDFKVEAAQSAFAQIIDRHETLRTVFIDSNNGPLQIISEEFEFEINQVDLSELATDVQEQAIAKAIEQDNKLIFDLSNDLMLRVSYLCISNNKGLLLFNMHPVSTAGLCPVYNIPQVTFPLATV